MACSLNSRSPVSTMSDTTKPNRVAPPRPPPPTISPQRTLNQTPSSVSLGESPVSPPRYEDSHPVPIRRGSEGEVEMRRRNKPSRRQSTRRSMRRRQRPEITIISSQPMNQHPAFADGAKGSHIPPEAPPSYDEAIKSTPTNTSAIELEMPVPESAPSPPSRVLPVDFVIFDQEDHSELNSRNQSSETEPKVFFCSTSVETRFSERVPYRSTSRNSNQNNSEGLNAHAETANSVVAYFSPTGSSPNNSSTQSVYVREGERTPVPTPRIRRKVSTTRCTVQEFLTNTRENQGTTLGSTTPAVRPRPKVPPKRPELIARFSGAHSDAADTSNPEHYTHVDLQLGSSLSRSEEVLTQPSHVDMSSHSPSSTNDVLSLFEDDLPGNTPSLPTPLQTRRLPPPPAPPSAGPRRPPPPKPSPVTNILEFSEDIGYASIKHPSPEHTLPTTDFSNLQSAVPVSPSVDEVLEDFGYASVSFNNSTPTKVETPEPVETVVSTSTSNSHDNTPTSDEFLFNAPTIDDVLSSESSENLEPVYAKVNKPLSPPKPVLKPKPRTILPQNTKTTPSSLASSEENLLQLSEPPPIPTSRPPDEDFEESINVENKKPSAVDSLLDFGFASESTITSPVEKTQATSIPSNNIEPLQRPAAPPPPVPKSRSESVRQRPEPPPPPKAAPRKSVRRKNIEEDSSVFESEERTSSGDVPLKPVNVQNRWATASKTPPPKPKAPPPIPETYPVGKSKDHHTPGANAIIKREKSSNSTNKGLQLIRRKSLQFKEKSMRIFKPRTSVDGMEKEMYHQEQQSTGPTESTQLLSLSESPEPTRNKTVTDTNPNQERRKPSQPPPRPAIPAVLQNKIKAHKQTVEKSSEVDLLSFQAEDPASNQNSNAPIIAAAPVNKPRVKPLRPAPAKPKQPTTLVQLNEQTTGPKAVGSPIHHTETSNAVTTDPILSPTKRVPPPKPTRPPKIMWKETTSPALSPVDTEDKSILEVAAMKVDKDKKVQIDVGMKKYITGEMYYVATVDYTPTNFTDLSFSCGEKITVMKRIDEELLFGRNEEGEEGPFPEKFVKLESNSDNENNSNSVAIMNHYNTNQSNNIIFDVDKAMGMHLPTPFEFTQDKHVSTTDTNCVRAKYDFVAKNEDELSVKAGDKLELISRVDSDWVKAKCEGILGILPVNFVNHDCSQLPLEQSIADTNNINLHCKQLPSEVNTTAVARYSFTGQDDTELTFHQNDVIHILGSINEEWLQGSLNGKKGIFPSNFVAMS